MKTKLLILLMLIVPVIPTLTGCDDSNPIIPTAQDSAITVRKIAPEDVNKEVDAPEKGALLNTQITFWNGSSYIDGAALTFYSAPYQYGLFQSATGYTSLTVKIKSRWESVPGATFKVSRYTGPGNYTEIYSKSLQNAGSDDFQVNVLVLNNEVGLHVEIVY